MRVFLTTLVLWLLPALALACPVCIVSPERTLADRVLEDRIAVLARPDPEDPFRFAVTDILQGDAATLADLPPIPFLVDSATRRDLAENPDHAVLMTYGATDAGTLDDPYAVPSQDWSRSITVTPERREVLDRILVEGQDWFWGGEPDDPPRFAFFAALHASPDPVLHRAALDEISRSSYALIRTLDPALSVDELRARLGEIGEAPYHGVYALMLGLHDSAEAEAIVRARADSAMVNPGERTGAWLTALIEQDGTAAIDEIADAFLTAGSGPLDDTIYTVIDALRVSGDARPDLRPVLTERLTEAAERRPELAAEAAYALYGWQDWSFLGAAREALASGAVTDHSAIYMLEVYRDTAADFVASGG